MRGFQYVIFELGKEANELCVDKELDENVRVISGDLKAAQDYVHSATRKRMFASEGTPSSAVLPSAVSIESTRYSSTIAVFMMLMRGWVKWPRCFLDMLRMKTSVVMFSIGGVLVYGGVGFLEDLLTFLVVSWGNRRFKNENVVDEFYSGVNGF